MKKFLLLWILFLGTLTSFSQLLSWTPNFAQESTTPFTITMDATKGNLGLKDYATTTDVYVHIGAITSLSTSSADWKYSKFTWATTPVLAQCTYLGSNKWSYTITGGLRSYFGISNASETIQKIAILFRSGDGSKVQRNTSGADMYIPIYTTALAARFTLPLMQPTYIPQPEPLTKFVGNTIPMTGVSNYAATLKLYLNGTVVATAAAATTISASPVISTSGNQQLVFEAFDGTTTKKDTVQFYVAGTVNVAAQPAGTRDGINYEANTAAVTLVLYAPGKTRVGLIGDFPGGSWIEQSSFQLNKTADGNRWWIRLTGLTPGTEYSFQYIVDGNIRVTDPYTEKILDGYNDPSITATTYPGLKAYPANLTSGIVGIFQTAAPTYTWKNNSFSRPDKRNLVIYEMLVRDFVTKHDWNTLRDSLNYLKSLGINAIEVMPVNEFEGNLSWGYNSDFYLTPDKYYGPALTMKRFVDSCHSRGIAVLMDVALNHQFGSSPLVQLYWDAANNRPASNNPWFNAVPKHAYNVGYDMNHESLATRYFFSRVVEHWLTNFKVDGFRFDLAKGFTQTQTCDNNGANCNVGSWGNYDASRVAIWQRYYDTLQLKSPGSIAVLEYFADNGEEQVLSNYGFLLWGNLNNSYNQATMGFPTDWDFSWGVYSARGWANPYLVTYMESHDEERLMYKNLQYGNSSGTYNTKSLATALKRMELASAFFIPIPGPKMIWQFGELGYDYSINFCQNGSISTDCRTDAKPIRWDYRNSADRNKLFHVYAALINLRTTSSFKTMYNGSSTTSYSFGGAFKWLKVDQGTSHIVVIGNFDVVQQTGSVTFPTAGTWYDHLNNTTITATGANQSFTLAPGEYHVFTSSFVALPVNITSFNGKNAGNTNVLSWAVSNEQNLHHYELQRSLDGLNFSAAGTISATGSSNYTYNDDIRNIGAPVYFYRLKSVDVDGDYKYSAVVKITVNGNGTYVIVSPNPFTEKLLVNIESPIRDEARISIADISGRQVFSKQVNLSTGNNAFEIVEAARLSRGVYIMTVTGSRQQQTIRIVKGK